MTEAVPNKPTILVVDDSRLMRVAARKILKNDFDVLEASDGEEALDVLRDAPAVSLVMSDLSMPNLDGLGLLKRLRESESEQTSSLPVIIVTGAEDDDGSKNKALSAGASDFITKPFESVQLLARAKAQVKQQQTEQALKESEADKEKLEAESQSDPLTGLDNHRAFENHVEEGLSYARRHRTELAVVQIQVEKYKVMFLRQGKKNAEEVLRQVSQVLNRNRRREDKVARTAMDTFAILLPSANAVGAKRVAEQIHDTLRSHEYDIDGHSVEVRTSLAVVTETSHAGITARSLIDDAEALMKEALSAGGDCIKSQRPGHQAAVTAGNQVEGTPEPVTAPVVATTADVEQALQALSHQRSPGQDLNALARAVLPLLIAWSDSNDGACRHELEGILNALNTGKTSSESGLESLPY